MDTKWNNMDNDPGADLEYYVAGQIRKTLGVERSQDAGAIRVIRPGSRAKALTGFLAFFLGVTLVIESIGAVGGRLVWERDLTPRFTRDWQETDSFRDQVASYLKDFLTLGAGGTPDFYQSSYWEQDNGLVYDTGVFEHEMETYVIQSEATEGIASVFNKPCTFATSGGSARSDSVEPDRSNGSDTPRQAQPVREPDADYQADKNVLYYISGGTGENKREYRNVEAGAAANAQSLIANAGEEYNFFLVFENGKASITKDGAELDVYGDGFYNEDSLWFVPGYHNFPASKQLDGVTVCMAVRKTPLRYYSVDYQTGGQMYSGSMYDIAQRVQETWNFYSKQAAVFCGGLALLCVWFFLRREKRLADAKIASWTNHVWTEARFAIGLLLALCFVWSDGWGELYYSLRDSYWIWQYGYAFSEIGSVFLRLLLSNLCVLIAWIWFVWLIRNDHRYNPKEARRSLLRPFFRELRASELKRPVEKRLNRSAAVLGLCAFLMGAELIAFLVIFSLLDYEPLPYWSLWTLFLLPVLLGAAVIPLLLRRQCALARDLGRLANQVEAVRAGDLSTPLDLPEDADLQKTADSLNDIQAGMKAALEEQTRSERMKVELVSNVSHDLKTPLTSILSYAELLRQEELPPAAADYARIIDEKAQRLKSMVQDVFEVSKAAADQLPVHLERLDLAKLLRQTLADLDGPIQRSALTFKTDLPEEPVMITADGKRLYRVFQNLIDNALRYALEGSRVYLTLKTAGGQAEASMRNTSRTELPEGVDFTARFVRGDASRTDGGSGLGLSIVRSFTEACGGTFRVETVADLFTAVVTFPLS